MGSSAMTLVEVMLAITLFSALMAAVVWLVRAGLQSQGGWDQRLSASQQLERALTQLEQDLESAQPIFTQAFIGESQSLEFADVEHVSVDGAPPAPRWVRTRYRLESVGTDTALVREITPLDEPPETATPLRREGRLRVAAGRFAFGVLDAQQQLQWVASWAGAQHGIPRLIKFDLTLPAQGDQPPLAFSRVVRNPAGTLPTMETP